MSKNTRDPVELQKIANRLRLHVLRMIGVGHRGHYGGSFSSAEIMSVLYFSCMRHDPCHPKWEDRDRFVISKGHSCPILYAALYESGYFEESHLDTFKDIGSILQGHPDVLKTPGVEANTGSLGQGISIALGMALGLRMDASPARVYTILGDGEIGEGQVWEAAIVAAHYKLNNLVAFLDHNKVQAMGFTRDRIDVGNLADKWRAFGWHVIEVDGHDISRLLAVVDEAHSVQTQPTLVLCHTIKSKGIRFGENSALFHNNLLTLEQWQQVKTDLETLVNC